ncbi:Flavin-dependent oxidoreductase, luciferase family (includes alkanesulfonate monooxygenase SsuD and methylene tetrahydromethanopterin reductase) [Pseudonocardia thermophila]|uniref:Flavin-dependent oxidoreductase, luciferase family (Includes alkanesulfonate monooxygenase SsuD and methylene tetrahydromethanopterin reductase) n=1 Tax=Pseudonocardia thermophila TaxID=1848 RepID=A0A1M7BFL3_PSETH|nr:LLM class flavin-dependent oxidoreductase [Pseudonocardia thermophila]SHL53815.1 Flavin-dependent oxidoreductase, luciferase family (includes alkanesulfonate monooxygenase SsuD and methylene tetrahydromethanopterin reductase) [Pseudonocardia thermophila]
MDFIFLSEADTPPGMSTATRYQELVEEVLLAEKVGFDYFGTSEQHVPLGTATTSAPEVLYPYLMALTSRIKFIHLVTLLPVRMNHALRVAERVATEDIVSNGRIELGTGRGNTTLALRAFEVDPKKNKSEWREGIEVIRRAFTQEVFSFVGEHYKIPPRSLVPRPIQYPHPPISVAASGPDSHLEAGKLGIGVLSATFFLGFEYSKRVLQMYEEAFDSTEHVYPAFKRKMVSLGGGMVCADTTAEARKKVDPVIEGLKVQTGAYELLSKLSADYAHMGAIKNVDLDDKEYLLNDSASFIVGDPDACIEQVRRYEEYGVEALIMRIDGMPFEDRMRSIELFGKYVIPHFKKGTSIVRPADDVLREIRAKREAHEAELATFLEREAKGVGTGALA